jgi:hypothetical protein
MTTQFRFLDLPVESLVLDKVHATGGDVSRIRIFPETNYLLPPLKCLRAKDYEGNNMYQLAFKIGENEQMLKKIEELEEYIKREALPFVGSAEFVPLNKTPGDLLSLLNVKLQHWQGMPKFELFNGKSKKLIFGKLSKMANVENHLPKNCIVTAIIRCNGIWINSTKWGISFSLMQALVDPPQETMCGKWTGPDEMDV